MTRKALPKSPTGISGFDDITEGGLPRGRPTLVCGGPGCGKTLFGVEFIARGAIQFQEPGVIITFEERARDLAMNASSLGFDLNALVRRGKLVVDHVRVERSEIAETGQYDLEGLFVRIAYAVESIGAKRVLIDTVEALFAGLDDQGVLRSELRRLFQWLKDRGLTAVITGERGEGPGLTRRGLEEYVSDCVVVLDNRVIEQISTRRLRIVKYRGTTHGTNEYPFLIDVDGITIFPISGALLTHGAPRERITTGVQSLDDMLGGKGLYKGTTVLVSGSAGAGKTMLGAHAAEACCRNGGRSLMMAFEESPAQIEANMASAGIDLARWRRRGKLEIHASRPTLVGLEQHIVILRKLVNRFHPDLVVYDPMTPLMAAGTEADSRLALTRMIDFLKTAGVTSLFTALSRQGKPLDEGKLGVSSIMDAWIDMNYAVEGGRRRREISIIKARGIAHSNETREFRITGKGLSIGSPRD